MSTNGFSVELRDQSPRRKSTKRNGKVHSFCKTICAGRRHQLELIVIPPGNEIADETSDAADRILFIVAGSGKALLDGEARTLVQQDVLFVPAGTSHEIRNTGSSRMRVFSVTSPPAASFIF